MCLRRQRCRPRYKQPHPLADLACRLRRQIQQPHIYGRHAKEQRRLKRFKFQWRFLMFKPFQQAHPATTDQPCMHSVSQCMNVEQRQRQQKTVRLRYLPTGDDVQRIRREIVVRKHRPFRCPRCPRCVDDPRSSVAIQIHCRPAHRHPLRRSHPLFNVFCRDMRRRFGIAENVRDLPVTVQNIDRHKDHSGFHCRQIEQNHLRAISHIDTKPVPLHQTSLQHQVRQLITPVINFAKSEVAVLPLQRYTLSAVDEREIKKSGKCHSH